MSAPALLDFLPWMRYPLQGLWEGSTTNSGSSILGGFSAQAVLVPFLTFWLLLEVAFFVLILYLHSKLNERTLPPPSPLTPQQIIRKVLEILDQIKDEYPFERFITLWCGAHDISDVKEGNFRTWLAWALMGKHLEELSPQEFRMIVDSTEMIELRYQHRLARGFNPDIEPIRMTLEPLKIIHRPLALYMGIAFVPRMLGELYLAMLGFTKLRLHETNYWYRPATSPGAKLPLVFFHGVGPGVCAYGGLVSRLADDRSAVLVEIPHIAMGLEEFRAKSAEEVVSLVRAICVRHEILHFCVAGHSYGSILAGWVIRGMREEVKQAVLLDPVCFLLCLPTTPLNFLYNDRVQAHTLPWSPSKGRNPFLNSPVRTHKLHVLDLVLHYFVSRELTVANAMRRQFWWHTKILYPEDLHCPTVVGLASEDVLLSAHAIRKHLEEPSRVGHVKLLWWEGGAHGELLTDLPAMEELDMTIRLQEKERYHGSSRGGGPPVWEGTGRRRRGRAAGGGNHYGGGSKMGSVEGGAAPRALGGGSGGGRAPQRASFRHPAPVEDQATLTTTRRPADSDNGHHQQQQAGEEAAKSSVATDDDKAQAEPNSSNSKTAAAAAAAAHDKPQQHQEANAGDRMEEEEAVASHNHSNGNKKTAEEDEGARRKTMAMATREAETAGEPRLLLLEESSLASSSASSRP